MAETPVNAPMGQKGADPATRARRWKRAFLKANFICIINL